MINLLGLIFFLLISFGTGLSICLNIFSKLKHKILASYLGANAFMSFSLLLILQIQKTI